MNDLISRRAAIEAVRKIGGALASITTDGHETILIDKAAVQTELMLLPSAEPKKGKWIPQLDKWGDIVTTVEGYKCSECNSWNTDKDNFCPNCGARMESE